MAETAVLNKLKELSVARASWLDNFANNSNLNANDRNVDNPNNRLLGIAQHFAETFLKMKPRNLWQELCSQQNLELAFKHWAFHLSMMNGIPVCSRTIRL